MHEVLSALRTWQERIEAELPELNIEHPAGDISEKETLFEARLATEMRRWTVDDPKWDDSRLKLFNEQVSRPLWRQCFGDGPKFPGRMAAAPFMRLACRPTFATQAALTRLAIQYPTLAAELRTAAEECWAVAIDDGQREVCNFFNAVTVLSHRLETAIAILSVQTPDLPGKKRLDEDPPDFYATHSPDFACVNWCGTIHEFTKAQAACVKVLWEAMENRAPTVGQETILELAESSRSELRKVFEGHAAWGTMIVSPQKGRYRLNSHAGGKTGG